MSTGADDLRRQAELLELLKTRDAVLEAHHEYDATLAALEESRRGPDHGISPAQLREKVASLDDESEVQAQRLNALEDSSHKLREKVEALDFRVSALEGRLNTTYRDALKRIEQLERKP